MGKEQIMHTTSSDQAKSRICPEESISVVDPECFIFFCCNQIKEDQTTNLNQEGILIFQRIKCSGSICCIFRPMFVLVKLYAYLLYILNSLWVLRKPNAGKNIIFTFSALKNMYHGVNLTQLKQLKAELVSSKMGSIKI